MPVYYGPGAMSDTSVDSKKAGGAGERRPVMGGLDLGVGALLLFAVWVALPLRWAPVDVIGTLLGLGFVASGALLLRGHTSAKRVAKLAAGAALAVGVVTVIALAFTVGSLHGLYGPVGKGGAIILFVAALLLVPYLVVFPAAQLYFLLPRRTR